MSSGVTEQQDYLADSLRRYPTFAHAYLDACKLLLSVEGALLAYWTDWPASECEDMRVRLREFLGSFEPTASNQESKP